MKLPYFVENSDWCEQERIFLDSQSGIRKYVASVKSEMDAAVHEVQ